MPNLSLRLLLSYWVLFSLVVPGCAVYQFGPRMLHRNDIRTVHVPIVRLENARPELGARLTEALQREIERRTPYKVTGDPSADTTLSCRIYAQTKRVLTETGTDEARALDSVIGLQVSWVDRMGNILLENQILPPGEAAFVFTETERYVPEGGQSLTMAEQRALERIASAIVDQMEFRW